MNATLNRPFLRSAKWMMTAICVLSITNPVVAAAEQVPKVQDLCKILRDADRYDGKIVAVRGVYRTHFEWGGLYGERCKQVPIDGVKWPARVVTRGVRSDLPLPLGAEALLDRESTKALNREFEAAFKSGHDIECKVVMVGVLRSRDEKLFYLDKEGRRRRMGFGHLNAAAVELAVLSVKIVSPIKKIPRLM